MARQSSAHSWQTVAQRRISSSPAIASQSRAQASQTAAQAPQVQWCSGESRSMKPAEVAQISAQSMSSLMWSDPACFPPISRQCTRVVLHTLWQRWHASMQARTSA